MQTKKGSYIKIFFRLHLFLNILGGNESYQSSVIRMHSA